jgi:hypothetical protein
LLASIQETLESTWVTAVDEFTWSGVNERLEGCSECTDARLAVLGGCCAKIANADATEVGTVDFTLAEWAALCLWKGSREVGKGRGSPWSGQHSGGVGADCR